MSPFVDVSPCREIAGSIDLPGDKSISHRAVLLSILAEGPVEVVGCSPAADVAASLQAAQAFGVAARYEPKLQVQTGTGAGRGCQILAIDHTKAAESQVDRQVDVGNSGTTLRISMGICASIDGVTYLDGDMSIRRRPMMRVVEPLRVMGADITGEDGGARAPLVVRGAHLVGAEHHLPIPSAQVKSALLLAGLRAEGKTLVTEPALSRDHTERMLKYLRISIDISPKGLIVEKTRIPGGRIDVPADLSAAAAFLAAAAIADRSELILPWVGVNPTRTGFLDIIQLFGARVEIDQVEEISGEPRATIRIRSGDRLPLEVGGELALRAIDELPLVAVLGSFAHGRTVVSGGAELRVKETDRIAATVAGLRSMGVAIEATDEGFVVEGTGGPPAGGVTVDPQGDHRLAMAFAVAALGAQAPVRIEDPGCVAVSHPTFFEDLSSVVVP